MDGNALASRALLRGAALLERAELAERALETLGFLREMPRRDGLMAHFVTPSGQVSQGSPLFTDQAGVIAATLDAYETTGERRWLEQAKELAAAAERFAAADGRYRRPVAAERRQRRPARPAGAFPRGERADGRRALRLTAHTGDERYRDNALHVLAAWLPYYQRYGVGAAPYGAALPAHRRAFRARRDRRRPRR